MRPLHFLVASVLLVAANVAAAQPPGEPPPAAPEVLVTPPPPDTGPYGPAAPGPTGSPPVEPAAPKADQDFKSMSGYKPGDGFLIRSDDPNYKMRIGFQGAYKLEPIYQAEEWQDRRAFYVLRPIFAGNFYREWIRFSTSLELNGNPPFLLDSYIEINPSKEFGVRIGQQYTLISRHEQFGPQQILFPEWAPVAEYFWTGRDKGATIWGIVADDRFEYYAGAYGGSPLRQFSTISGNYVLEARLAINPMGATGPNEFPYIADEPAPFRVSFSLQGYYGKVQLATENFNPSSFRFDVEPTETRREQLAGAADVYVQSAGFAFLAEGYVRRTDPDMMMMTADDSYVSVGAWGQLGVLLVPRTLDIGLRFNWLDADIDLDDERFLSGEVQMAWYISHSQNLVLRARYGYGKQDSPGKDALGNVTLFTREGSLHIGTLQLTLAF